VNHARRAKFPGQNTIDGAIGKTSALLPPRLNPPVSIPVTSRRYPFAHLAFPSTRRGSLSFGRQVNALDGCIDQVRIY